MSDEYKQKQRELLEKTVQTQDIVITTALIPGKPAPELITEDMVNSMKPGAVIMDMAVMSGGNCKLSRADEVVDHSDVRIVSFSNLPSLTAIDSSPLYARNLYHFLINMLDAQNKLHITCDDELVDATLLTHAGDMRNIISD